MKQKAVIHEGRSDWVNIAGNAGNKTDKNTKTETKRQNINEQRPSTFRIAHIDVLRMNAILHWTAISFRPILQTIIIIKRICSTAAWLWLSA